MFNKNFLVYRLNIYQALAVLALRLYIATIFMGSGFFKKDVPFTWADTMAPGLIPGWLQFITFVFEILCGVAVLLGALTRLVSFILAVIMAVAIYVMITYFNSQFFSPNLSYGPNIATILILLMFMTLGPGNFSLDRLIFGYRK